MAADQTNLFELKGKTVLINIDIGKAEEMSADICKSGGKALVYQCFVLDANKLREVYEEVCDIWGVPDFLINGAGGNHPSGSTEQSKFLQFDKETGKLNDRGREIIANTPIGRFGEPEELIGTLIWLLSDTSKFVAGAVIPVDGGFSSYSI